VNVRTSIDTNTTSGALAPRDQAGAWYVRTAEKLEETMIATWRIPALTEQMKAATIRAAQAQRHGTARLTRAAGSGPETEA
jgi:hypothetical protein